MLDPESVKRALEGVTRVFHMAGVVGHRASDEARLQAVNVDGARTVLDLCARAGVERVVFTSSVSTIGPAGGPGHPRDEGAWLIDGDDGRGDFRYGRTKAAGEQLALAAAAAGLDVVITNPGFVIGPGDVHRVSSWAVEEYLRGRLRFTVSGGLSYVDVRDVAVGHLAGRGARQDRRALHPHERRRQPQPPRLLRARGQGYGQAAPPAARLSRNAAADPAGGLGAPAAAAAGRPGAGVERPLVVLHRGQGPCRARLLGAAHRRDRPRHRRPGF